MKFFQQSVQLPAYPRGFHLVTTPIEQGIPEIREISRGMLQVFIQHTSAGLTINENADPDVRTDFASHFNEMVPENAPHYVHTIEGPDDMPAHIKSTLTGANVLVPITSGSLNLGTWQGIYLCEFRNQASGRKLVLSAWGY
jgi:secondary thiamine-phosphate synthase enzyme